MLGLIKDREFRQGMKRSRKEVKGMKGDMQAAGKAAGGFGRMLKKGMALAAPLVGVMAFRKALNEGVQDIKALTKYGTFLDPSVNAFEKYTGAVTALERKIGVADEILADAMIRAKQAGIAEADVMDFVTKSATRAEATFQDVGNQVDATTWIMNNYGKTLEDVDEIQGALWVASRMGASEVGALGKAVGIAGSAVKELGLDYKETLAMVGVLGTRGFKGMRGLMSMTSFLSKVAKPTPEAQEEAARLGFSWDVEDIKKMGFQYWLMTVTEGLERAEKSGENIAKIMAKLGAESTSLGGFSALVRGGQDFRDTLDEINIGVDEMAQRVVKRHGDIDFQLKRLDATQGQMWESFGVGMSKGMLSEQGLTGNLDDVEKVLGDLEKSGKEFGKVMQKAIAIMTNENGLPAVIRLMGKAVDLSEKLGGSFAGAFFGGLSPEQLRAYAKGRMGADVPILRGKQAREKFLWGKEGPARKEWRRGAYRDLAASAEQKFSGLSLKEALAGQSFPGESLQFDFNVIIDHTIKDGDKNREHTAGAAAGASGAGNAQVNTRYRFSVMRRGQGVETVRPMARNVVFGHLRSPAGGQ